ncbi:hypothetical protein C0Q70_06836 [Pomacea canaliculata]|uniref:Uncharacterized protein n=1 Tax=Pomacea canaliculata TaxID=400727 RepID=A0A2T7PDC6_POMCA|nr:hypothetical protein C0Q70_06836 [Pomacea canaliculata]
MASELTSSSLRREKTTPPCTRKRETTRDVRPAFSALPTLLLRRSLADDCRRMGPPALPGVESGTHSRFVSPSSGGLQASEVCLQMSGHRGGGGHAGSKLRVHQCSRHAHPHPRLPGAHFIFLPGRNPVLPLSQRGLGENASACVANPV